jgi:hypothetical protein
MVSQTRRDYVQPENQVQIFRVRKRITRTKNNHKSYRYQSQGLDWSYKEMEELTVPFKFIYSMSMTEEEKIEATMKWSHKLVGEFNELFKRVS